MPHWTVQVVERVNAHLEAFFEEKRALAERTSPIAPELVNAIAELTMRGGKRLRPAALHAGFAAIDPGADPSRTLDTSAALELLQTYLLVQDDWMDGDEERRGGPAVHVALAQKHGNDAEMGARLAILAGDLASGFAWELLHRAPFPSDRACAGRRAFSDMHFEVVSGQQLDVMAHPDVALMHDLKSGSYTVRGPLKLGAILAGADDERLELLSQFAGPIGVAFQLRDDLLGTFGDPELTGKPSGNDLRVGKNTSLVAEARSRLPEAERQALEQVLSGKATGDADVDAAKHLLVDCGARSHVESRLDELIGKAHATLVNAPLSKEGITMLEELTAKLAARDR